MQRNRNVRDGRLSSRAVRFASIFVLMLMPVMTGLVRAQWVPFSPPDSLPDRVAHATVYDPVNDRIYMFGGTTAGSNVSLCQRYDPAQDTWTLMAPMFTSRDWISAAYVKGRVYVPGGYSNASTILTNNEEYTIATNSWATREPLPVAVCAYMQGVWRDSLIYILGGYSGTGIEAVQVYDPFTNSWAIGTPMPQPGDMGGAVIVGDTIYITNGYNRRTAALWGRMLKGAINPASPTQITWLWDPMLLGSWGLHGTVSLRNKVYWLGMAFPLRDDVTIGGWVYDPATGVIDTVPSLLLEGVTRPRSPAENPV